MRPGYYEIEGRDPENPDGPPRPFYISRRDLESMYKFHPLKALNARAALKVLTDPDVIFKSLRDDVPGWGYCYAGQPEEWHVTDGVTAPFDRRKVLCVFVSSGSVVYTWRREDAVRTADGLRPVDFENRFEELLWARTKKS